MRDTPRPVFVRVFPALACAFADYSALTALMPVLPYHLRDKCSLGSDDAVAQWAGAISSVQFAAVMAACLALGPIADRLGAKRAMQLTMTGNVITITASGFAHGLLASY